MKESLVSIALREVGVRETPGKNNVGVRIQQYQTATWLVPGAWPWCAAFTCWVLREYVRTNGINVPKGFLCRDPRAYGWIDWARKWNQLVLPRTTPVEPGDFIVFNFSHIGIARSQSGQYVHTIEGNTNGRGDRDSEYGDGVWLKTRGISLVKNIIRLKV